ncbi:MAG TPA: pseudouridine synthase [Bacteroidia bacterium]
MKADKYINEAGYTSRRKATSLISEKRVMVNGIIAKSTTEIHEGDIILIDGKELIVKDYIPTYIAYNKPKGIECTTEQVANNIIDVIGHEQKIYPIGRLDKESEGLILLTNHGEIINKIAKAEFGHEKEYIVTLNLPVRKQFLREITEGVMIQGEKTKPCVVSLEPNAKRIFRITLKQGLNRQIRRMCNAADYQVIKLQRVRVMNIKLGKLKVGEWRDLTQDELTELFIQLA